jgi:hypothetical protein
VTRLPKWWPYPPIEDFDGVLSPAARVARAVKAGAMVSPLVAQVHFAWGNPGTQTGHTLDTIDTDRAPTVDGTGNYKAFLRLELEQQDAAANDALVEGYWLKVSKNGGAYTRVILGSSSVRLVDDTNIVDGSNQWIVADVPDGCLRGKRSVHSQHNVDIDSDATHGVVVFAGVRGRGPGCG